MRKSLITPTRQSDRDSDRGWLVLDEVASVEVTSEAADFPVEGALTGNGQQGWRADTPGSQTIRLLFDTPQTVRFIRLVFREEQSPRTQEFVLRWRPAHGADWKDIVRQQWNFSPPNTVLECEEYKVDLASAAALELTINPDINQVGARASLQQWQLSVEQDTNF
ncbi:MAG TPA: hypothetical protein VF772_10265 [Terriglobales bacterium]